MTSTPLLSKWFRHRMLPGLTAAICVLSALLAAGCGSDDATTSSAPATVPRVLVTTSVLGTLVEDLVGDSATVEVLMPNGVDPHEFQPSAKDAQRLQDATLIVTNGTNLEESIADAIERATDAGVPMFTATDHVKVREFGEGELADEGPLDPHIWLDPVRMSQVTSALSKELRTRLGIDVADRSSDLARRLADLNVEVAAQVASIPGDQRELVTGHESMGYFADRYGLRLVGAIIPSLSSQAEPSAADLATLATQIEKAGVPAIFTEIGTPTAVAEAIADQTGVRVVEVASHNLPDDGSYFTFMRDVTRAVVEGLGGSPSVR